MNINTSLNAGDNLAKNQNTLLNAMGTSCMWYASKMENYNQNWENTTNICHMQNKNVISCNLKSASQKFRTLDNPLPFQNCGFE